MSIKTTPTVAVVGGAGFIGSHLVKKLLQKNFTIHVIDNLSTGSLKNIPLHDSRVLFHELDILTDDLKPVLSKSDTVFHLAAMTSVQESLDNPWSHFETNLHGTIRLAQSAHGCGVNKFIFSSTAAVYGDSKPLPQKESNTKDPQSAYGISKFAAEQFLKNYFTDSSMEIICLRYFNVFGEEQPSSGLYASVLARFLKQYREDQALTVTGLGDSVRDFVYVGDVCEANIAALKYSASEGFDVFNVATGQGVSVIDIAHTLQDNIIFTDARKEIKKSIGDPALAQNSLHWSPQVNVLEWLSAQK